MTRQIILNSTCSTTYPKNWFKSPFNELRQAGFGGQTEGLASQPDLYSRPSMEWQMDLTMSPCRWHQVSQ